MDGPLPEIKTETANEGPVEWTESFHFSPIMDKRSLGQRESNVTEDQLPAVTEAIGSNQFEMASVEPHSDMITMFQCMMQEQRRRDEERKRDDDKRNQQRREDEERRQEMLTKQFERQMTLIFQHQEGQRQTEQEFMKTQQLELHEAQQKAVELNTQRQTYQSVLNRLPRLTSTTEVIPFFTGFEQNVNRQ